MLIDGGCQDKIQIQVDATRCISRHGDTFKWDITYMVKMKLDRVIKFRDKGKNNPELLKGGKSNDN